LGHRKLKLGQKNWQRHRHYRGKPCTVVHSQFGA
jgi:hypothetical protein